MQTATQVLTRLEEIIKTTKQDYKQMTGEQWGEVVNVINRMANDLRCVISERDN